MKPTPEQRPKLKRKLKTRPPGVEALTKAMAEKYLRQPQWDSVVAVAILAGDDPETVFLANYSDPDLVALPSNKSISRVYFDIDDAEDTRARRIWRAVRRHGEPDDLPPAGWLSWYHLHFPLLDPGLNPLPALSEALQAAIDSDKRWRQSRGFFYMVEAAEIMAAAHGLNAADFLKTRMRPAYESGLLHLLDPKDGGPVKGRQCRASSDWVTPSNVDEWLERDGFAIRWPAEKPQALASEPEAAPDPVVAERESGGVEPERNLPWWRASYDIHDMAQTIGAKLQSEGKRPSAAAVSKEIEKRIRDVERSRGRDRSAPNHDTIRGVLTGWRYKPD